MSRSTPAALSLAFLACAVVAAWTSLSGAPAPLAAAPLLVLGAAWPLLLRWSPTEPSALKLALYGGLLSPLVLGSFLGGIELFLPVRAAWSATFAACGLSQLATLRGRRVRLDRLGAAAVTSVGLGLAVALSIGWLLLALGNGPRLTHVGALSHAGLAQALERGHPWENPWLAGARFPAPLAYPFLVRLASVCCGIPTPSAAALVSAASLAAACVALYLLVAPLWRSGRRAALAVPLAVFGANALGGLWLLVGASATSPAAVTNGREWASALAAALPRGGAAPYGLAVFFQPSPAGCAIAYAVAAWTAAAHGLRHGRRPWVGLTAVCALATLLLHPALGVAATAAVLAAGLARPGAPGVRAQIGTALAFAGLPALLAWRTLGAGAPAFPLERPLAAAGWFAGLLGLAALPLLLRGPAGAAAEREGGRATILALCGCACAAALACAGLTGAGEALELARWPLAALAAGGLVAGLGGPLVVRAGTAVLAAALAVGGGGATVAAARVHLAFARSSQPVRGEGRFLVPEFQDEVAAPGSGLLSETVVSTPAQVRDAQEVRRRHLARTYLWLRDEAPWRDGDPILVRGIGTPLADADDPDPATLYTDLPLWVDRSGGTAFGDPAWRERADAIARLFGQPEWWDPYLPARLAAVGRPLVFVVVERDREATHPRGAWEPFRGVDLRLQRAGARREHVEGTVAVYVLDPRDPGGEGADR